MQSVMLTICFGLGFLSAVLAVPQGSGGRAESRALRGGLDNAPKQQLQILGLFDSGTSLLHASLEANFPGMFELRGSAYFDGLGPGVWKHANLDALVHFEPGHVKEHRNSRVVAVAMVRNPLSWLQAVRKAPYDFEDCVRGRRWLSHTCALPEGAPAHQASWLGERLSFGSLPAIWSNWTASYEHLGDYGFDRSVVLRYEDLVTDPSAELARVAELAGLTLPSPVLIQEEPSKDNGQPHGRQEALRLIQMREYLANYSQPDLHLACAHLDKGLAQRLAYLDCSDVAPADSSAAF